jgi:hypothetical protein
MNFTSENQGSTITITSTEEDEAFKDLEKAIKNWHKATPYPGFWAAFIPRLYSYPSETRKTAQTGGFLRCFSATLLKIVVDLCLNESRIDFVD